MSKSDDPRCWAQQFGLACAPLFEHEPADAPGDHAVLLDGAYGTFALSVSEEELWRDRRPADWIWSSDVPHHVTVTAAKIAVLRWDRPDAPRVFERRSVERSLERFYGFLNDDRLRSNRGVVDHLLGFFRRLRSLVHAAGLPDDRAIDAFTAAMTRLIVGDGALPISAFGLAEDAEDVLAALNGANLDAALRDVGHAAGTMSQLSLHPSLAVRHAGGQLFQEAHFELIRGATDFDLFGVVGAAETAPVSRGGTHFTPATLARSLIECALNSLAEPVRGRRALTLCDPACGSGVFLHESLRALRRAGFDGHLRLIGYDISLAAIAMARFAIAASLRDWTPAGGISLDLRVGDTLGALGMPAADVIVMNPPFIGFAAQTPAQREQLTAAIGKASGGRGDYSMAFVLRALEALQPGGVLGTLFPASLLSLKAASTWRDRLLELGDVRFLGSIGEFGLFSHALVQVAAAVFGKDHAQDGELLALITENDPQATGTALRRLRRLGEAGERATIVEEMWSIFPVPVEALRERPTWRLPTPKAERLVRALTQAGLPTVGDLFEIAQGIQTGLNEALLLTGEEFNKLPKKEQRWFRRATMTDSIQNGQIVKDYWLFFPHIAHGPASSDAAPAFSDAEAVRAAVPRYFASYLAPNRDKLERRASIVRAKRADWWGLMHPRDWSLRGRPRIITKFFGAEGSFAGDYDASHFAVMGHVWTMKPCAGADLAGPDATPDDEQLAERDLLAAYVGLCNSSLFVRLLGLYAPNVAGGQFDLSRRHVAPIPVPDLHAMSLDPATGRAVRALGILGLRVDLGSPEWRRASADLVGYLYGGIDLDAFGT
ncbi:hypothetical protein FHR71_001763 [Methylobacterium sp. RAS18]|nr:hypothetical protein [Methylobacterium sp. RAS18]